MCVQGFLTPVISQSLERSPPMGTAAITYCRSSVCRHGPPASSCGRPAGEELAIQVAVLPARPCLRPLPASRSACHLEARRSSNQLPITPYSLQCHLHCFSSLLTPTSSYMSQLPASAGESDPTRPEYSLSKLEQNARRSTPTSLGNLKLAFAKLR